MAVMDSDVNLSEYHSGWEKVILQVQDKCQKVIFDIKQIKKLSKVYSVYNIPHGEHILAYCKGNVPLVPLTVEGIIFTEQAVFFYPYTRVYNGAEINYIRYDSFGSMVFYQNGPQGEVFALTQNDETRLLGPSLISKNTAGLEVLLILYRIQKELFNRNFLALDTYKSVVSAIVRNIQNDMGVEPLTPKSDAILKRIMKIPSFTDDAVMVKAEYLFREFDNDKYDTFVNSISKYGPSNVVSQLNPTPLDFYKRFIQFLTETQRNLTYSTLSKINKNIGSLEEISVYDRIIQIYLNIRMNQHDFVRSSLQDMREKYGSSITAPIEWFHCRYCYRMMDDVYDLIINQSNVPEQYNRCVDGIGLTPLHYAIILKNESAIHDLLRKTPRRTPSPYPFDKESSRDKECTRMYDYEIVGCGKQLESIHELLQKYNESVIEVMQKQKNLGGN